MAKKKIENEVIAEGEAILQPEENSKIPASPAGRQIPKSKKEKLVTSNQSPVTTKKAKTMDELLAQTGQAIHSPRKTQIVEGIVTEISRRSLLIDIGAKTEGLVTDKEFEVAIDFIKNLHVGDTIKAYVMSAENERGQILLSLKKAAMDQKWDAFKAAMDKEDTITVRGLELNKGGMIVSYESIRGFIPTSQFGKQSTTNLEEFLGKTIKVKIIEVDREKNRLIFSERHVSEEEMIKQKSAVLGSIKVGEVYDGVVASIMPFGAFVILSVPTDEGKGQIEGLVHISEISWEKVENPSDYVKAMDSVKVKVLSADQATGKLNLSIKQTTDDPWTTAKERYPEGTVASGTISRVAQFGVFVHLETGIDGLVHISKIVNTEIPRVGEEVSVTVESVDPEARRMSLSLTPTEVPMGYK